MALAIWNIGKDVEKVSAYVTIRKRSPSPGFYGGYTPFSDSY